MEIMLFVFMAAVVGVLSGVPAFFFARSRPRPGRALAVLAACAAVFSIYATATRAADTGDFEAFLGRLLIAVTLFVTTAALAGADEGASKRS